MIISAQHFILNSEDSDSDDFDLFHTFMENSFPVREHLTSDHIICGDFNLNLLNAHELQTDASMFYNDMQCKCCYQLV